MSICKHASIGSNGLLNCNYTKVDGRCMHYILGTYTCPYVLRDEYSTAFVEAVLDLTYNNDEICDEANRIASETVANELGISAEDLDEALKLA